MARAASEPTAPGPPASVLAAIRHLLRPLVRLLLHFQIPFPVLTGLLKEVYVSVAEREFRIEGRAQTDSRLSLLTGVHRKDVRRLRGRAAAAPAVPAGVSVGGQLLARWASRPELQDAEGRPLPLARTRARGDGPAFDELVEAITRDVRPRAVLDELVRQGAVEVDAEERVRLVRSAFVPREGLDEKAFYLGRNLHDHIAAAAHNLAGGSPPFTERSAYHGGLSDASVAELAQLGTRLGMETLRSVYQRASELHERDAAAGRGGKRARFGIYFYAEPEGGIEETDGDAT